MSMFNRLKTSWHKKSLTRPELSGIFDPPKPDEWVSIDCEMTGLNPRKHHLLSIAAIHINGNVIDTGNGLHLVCRPPVMPTEDTIIIHGLRPFDVEHGLNYDQMLENLLPFISNRPIVGFCPQLDMGFLNALTKDYMGAPLPNEVIDIRHLYNRRHGKRSEGITHKSHHLDSIMKELDIPDLGAHDAYNDAVMTAMTFMHLR